MKLVRCKLIYRLCKHIKHAARHFSRLPDCSLVVDGCLNGEVLCTDPVPQAGPTIPIQTEIAWEMQPKTLQQHKLHRTPVKLQVYDHLVCICVYILYTG